MWEINVYCVKLSVECEPGAITVTHARNFEFRTKLFGFWKFIRVLFLNFRPFGF